MNDILTTLGAHKVNNSVAAGLMTAPLWITYLQSVSEVAALFLPILGALWFIIQMYFYIKNKGRK